MNDSIDSILNSKNHLPIIFIFGEEDFLIEESVSKLIKHFCPNENSFYDFDSLNGDEVTESIIVGKCSAYPMVNEKRVVVVKHLEKMYSGRTKKAEKNSALNAYLSNPSSSTVLILVAEIDTFSGIATGLKGTNSEKFKKQIDNAKFPYNLLLANYTWVEFPKVYDSSFPKWIAQRIKSNGKTISDEACELLFAQTTPVLRDIANEVEKLCLYAGDRKNIEINDVLNISGATRANNVFELQNAIGSKNLSKSLKILYNMLATDRQEMLIITMLTRYFTIVWKLQEEMSKTTNNSQLASAVGVNPYFLKDYSPVTKLYKPAELNNALIALCDADLELKSSGGDNLLTMQSLITRIIEGK